MRPDASGPRPDVVDALVRVSLRPTADGEYLYRDGTPAHPVDVVLAMDATPAEMVESWGVVRVRSEFDRLLRSHQQQEPVLVQCDSCGHQTTGVAQAGLLAAIVVTVAVNERGEWVHRDCAGRFHRVDDGGGG